MKKIELNVYKLEELEEVIQEEIIQEEFCRYQKLQDKEFEQDSNLILRKLFRGWGLKVQYSLYHNKRSGLSFYSPRSEYIKLQNFFNMLEDINNNIKKHDLSECFYFDKSKEFEQLKEQINEFSKNNSIDMISKIELSIVCNSMFVHEKSCSVYMFDSLYDYREDVVYKDIIKNIEKMISEWYISTCIKLRDVGYDRLYPTDARIKENLKDNYYFSNGELYK